MSNTKVSRTAVLVPTFAIALLITLLAWAHRPEQQSPRPDSVPIGWHVVPSRPLEDGEGGARYLYGVSALAPDNVWAVGRQDKEGNANTLIEHWNGAEWTILPGPQFYQSMLYGVAALSASDAWAVGIYDAFSSGPPLTLHWDGIDWSRISAPNPGQMAALHSIAAASANDIWAVGDYADASYNGGLVEHWDGTQWSVAFTDTARSSLRGIDVVSTSDVWVVGQVPLIGGDIHILTMHWDGMQWSTIPSPNIGTLNHLNSVAAVSDNNVWTVGQSEAGALTMHWDGSSWSVVSVPTAASDATLNGVAATAANDAWAVGYYGIFPGIRTIALHWDGSQWGQAYTPSISTVEARLYGVAIDSDGNAWVVGNYGDTTPKTLVERYQSGFCCQMGFTDVQESDYFYEAVHHLYCNGVVSGYADNTFRPYYQTTRGQLAKIVVLSKGWPIVGSNGAHFSDVPREHPFYPYIETALSHEIISGYSDGTFRPSNNVTRGQLCKIIVIAQEWPIHVSEGPHFSDVPSSNAFFGYIETSYQHGIVQGYSDGTFRWGNSATRGQISKIVYNAITQP